MSYTIPPGSPKAIKAAAFGRELVKACKARGVPLKELERATGVGHTSLDNYRRGLNLPKVEVAKALASALDWPRLASLIVAARTFACARVECARTFRNDTGAPRRYCSMACRRIAENVRMAARRRRQAGQTGDGRQAAAAVRQLRSGIAIADERALVLEDAIGAMCRGCEPDGLCRTPECPLRAFSPLPLEGHVLRAEPRTGHAIRSAGWTPERRERFRDGSNRRWARPGEREAWSERMRACHAAMTPEERDAWRRKVGLAQMSPARRSEIASKGAATKRARIPT